jgi:hypothetical protein
MAATITVNSTDDSNIRNAILTLREAILIANGTLNVPALTVAEQAQINGTVGTAADRDTIAFNIGAIGSLQLIQPLSALPPISDPAIVDGWSQGGAGYNGLPLVELSGNKAGLATTRLNITAGSTVQGLAIGNNAGISIRNAPENLIQDNLISGNVGIGNRALNIKTFRKASL